MIQETSSSIFPATLGFRENLVTYLVVESPELSSAVGGGDWSTSTRG